VTLKDCASGFTFNFLDSEIHFEILMREVVGDVIESAVYNPSNKFVRIVRRYGS
jgi:hypothetical protein